MSDGEGRALSPVMFELGLEKKMKIYLHFFLISRHLRKRTQISYVANILVRAALATHVISEYPG